MVQKIVENEYITVEFHPERNLIYHVIHKPISGKLFAEAIEVATEVLREHGVTKWLSDDRKNGPLSEDNDEWDFEERSHRAIRYGWKYWALVVPTQVEATESLIPVIENLNALGLRMQVFTGVEEALKWLDKQK